MSLGIPSCSPFKCFIEFEQIGGYAFNAFVVSYQERNKLLAIHERNGGPVGLRVSPDCSFAEITGGNEQALLMGSILPRT